MATGTTSRASKPAFHDDDSAQATEYRTLSVLALISFILGLASPLSFGAVLLMIVPVAGIAVALLALRQIALSEGALAGRWAAVAGLVLCIIFVAAPISRVYILRTVRTNQAETFGHDWINLVLTGKTERAFRLTFDSTRPPAPPEPGAPPPKSPFDAFMDLPTVKAAAAAGADADVLSEGADAYEAPSFAHVFVTQRYKITPKSAATGARPLELLLMMEHAKAAGEGRLRWLVRTIKDANAPASEMPHS